MGVHYLPATRRDSRAGPEGARVNAGVGKSPRSGGW